MSPTRQVVREVIDVYMRAWTEQDPDLIITVFTEDATYHERVLEEPIRGHSGIHSYWRSKVVAQQSNIECELLNLYLDGDVAIAEWQAEFDDSAQGVRKRMREVAILSFKERRIASLREYWASAPIATLAAGPASTSHAEPLERISEVT